MASSALRAFGWPRLSHDGKRVAVAIEGETSDIWIYEIEDGTFGRLTSEGLNMSPVWTPDSTRVAFRSVRAGTYGIHWAAADFSNQEEELYSFENDTHPKSITPDGENLIAYELHPTEARNILVLPLDGDRVPLPYLNTSFNEVSPKVSPDGQWLAYVSNQSGRNEVYVRPLAEPGGRRVTVSTAGGVEPVWAPDGGELFYRNGRQMIAAQVRSEAEFNIGARDVLFEGDYLASTYRVQYDVHPDGQRFLMIRTGDMSVEGIGTINVILNWFEELKERVPTGGR